MNPKHLVFIGLSLSSSWGNGHATTYRALLRGLKARGHRITFLERDVPWYAANRDLPEPEFCTLALYPDLPALAERHGAEIAAADAVIVGSFVPEGAAVLDYVLGGATGVRGFYDIDTPVTLAGLASGATDYILARQIPKLDLYLSFSGGKVLDRLHDEFGAQRPVACYCAVDESRYQPLDLPKRWDLGYLGTYSLDRQRTLERLLLDPARRLPEMRFVVAGAQYPADIDWPANVDRLEHVPPRDHARFYAEQRFTLNVTRADMIAAGWSPSVRLFEAAACGTPILSDRWRGLTHLLPDAVRTVDDAEAVIDALRAGPDLGRNLAENARRIVLDRHTGAARARQFEDALVAAARPPPPRPETHPHAIAPERRPSWG